MPENMNRSDLICESDMEKIIADEDAYWEETRGCVKIERVLIKSEEYCRLMGKPVGSYVSLHFDVSAVFNKKSSENIVSALSDEIKFILEENGLKCKRILVVGLGNPKIACDSFGARVTEKIYATRSLKDDIEKVPFAMISVFQLDVFSKTGIEAIEAIRGISDSIDPEIVVVADSLVAKNPKRILRTVQISDSGITPGSGISPGQKEINRESVGRNIITIGVPTAVSYSGDDEKRLFSPCGIEPEIERLSSAVAKAIEKAFLN